MSRQPPADSGSDTEAMERALSARTGSIYELHLYITAASPQSTRALMNVRRLCEEHLAGRYVLEVLDIAKNPAVAIREHIIATPTLVRRLPLPVKRFIGDMSQAERILSELDLSGPPGPNEQKA